MMLSGIRVKAQRMPKGATQPAWVDVDVMELSNDEFAKWWHSIEKDQDKFYVVSLLRNLCINASDSVSDGQAP